MLRLKAVSFSLVFDFWIPACAAKMGYAKVSLRGEGTKKSNKGEEAVAARLWDRRYYELFVRRACCGGWTV